MNEEELNKLVESINDCVSKVIKQINDMNWFVRKSDGLLYYYKYKPATVNYGNNFFPTLKIIPVKGDKESLFKEQNNLFSYIPKNRVIHRDDLIKYKKEKDARE